MSDSCSESDDHGCSGEHCNRQLSKTTQTTAIDDGSGEVGSPSVYQCAAELWSSSGRMVERLKDPTAPTREWSNEKCLADCSVAAAESVFKVLAGAEEGEYAVA